MSLKDKNPDQTRCAKQLDSLSQSLLSLTPSVSAKDDSIAVEPRLHPSPAVALEVQALGLVMRLQSWSVSGHRGDVDKEVLLPLSKCLAAFARRATPSQFPTVTLAFSLIWKRIEKLGLRPAESSRSPLSMIYQMLATTSRESGNLNEAKKWFRKVKSLINPEVDSAAKCCAINAQLLAIYVKESHQVDENLMAEVLEGLKGSLGGTTAEMDDLLGGVCNLRKSVVNLIIAKQGDSSSDSQAPSQLLQTFVFQLPRFALRWLGKAPSPNDAAKELVRFDQRRAHLSTYLPHILDSAIMLVKSLLDEEKLAWDIMDSTLQDILAILETMGDLARPGTRLNPSPSYHVKISHLYYQQHSNLQKSNTKASEITTLKALRKSVDIAKNCSEAEQERAKLLLKWERFADLCRTSGRINDAIDALRSIRDHLVHQEVVSVITTNLATKPWWAAWEQSSEAELLSRTICNLAKLDRKLNDWTWLLVGSDKATALEHDFYAIITQESKYFDEVDLSSPTVKTLLQFFTIEKHPVRRLRVLTQLYTICIGRKDDPAELRTELEAALETVTKNTLGGDTGLAHYIPHLRALTTCLFGLADFKLDSPQVREALSNWKAVASKCQTYEQLLAYIDDPPYLLINIQIFTDYSKVKGLETLQTEFLELSISLCKLRAEPNIQGLISQNIALCLQHLSHGCSSKAEKLLADNQELISRSDVSKEIVVNFHLSAAEYHLSLGALDKAEQYLSNAQNAEVSLSNEPGLRKDKRPIGRISTAHAFSLYSNLALERGDFYHALRFAKTAVRKLFHDWTKLDELRAAAQDTSIEESLEASEKDTSMNSSYASRPESTQKVSGPQYWALARPLFRFLLQLSSTYSHVGMHQETVYYAEQALKVARALEANMFISQCLTWLSRVWLMANQPEKAIELATEAKDIILTLEPTYQNATMLCHLSSIYGEFKNPEVQTELTSKAESILKNLDINDRITSTNALELGMAGLSIAEKPVVKAATRRPAATKASRIPSKTSTRKPAAKKPVPPVEVPVQVKQEEPQLSFLRASILRDHSTRLLKQKDWAAAVTTLRTAYELSKLPADVAQTCFLMGVALIRQSLEQMGHDAVFSVVQDSTISFPSVADLQANADQSSPAKAPATRKGRGPSKTALNNTRSFIEKLREAQGHLLTAHSIASLNGDGDLVHRIATVLQNVVILLSNTASANPVVTHPAHATCSVELARNLTWRRERKTVRLENVKDSKLDWPIPVKTAEDRRTSLGLSLDMDCFQRDYVDIIPRSWNVISISLSDNENDLCIAKLQAGQNPFGIRLPLERATSRDIDSEVFSFRQGRAALLEIIEVANKTCHDARDMSQKGAKMAWWAEREQIDGRLKNIMDCVEHTWLGGFKGIFSQHHKSPRLFEKFQKRFEDILDKYLPSRRQIRGKRAKTAPTTRVNLDPRIYDLIIGLGDTTSHDDSDEPMTDLLYFIIDILQFHGERNAYDEIDFDRMMVDVYDARDAYHAEVKNIKNVQQGEHTILILDKSLHIFPWESLPCLQGLAVSRVPSLDCLRRSILEANPANLDTTDDDEQNSGSTTREGHYISINSGTYILNPSSDLKNTQATFGEPLSELPPSWNSVEMREPTEPEFESALTDRDLLLYFGHGSGAQYIRGRTIRKLEKCRAVALLMGCSSASLADVGRFESHGPVRNYMLAGSPAVVGTLWDVTDRDIDRFAGRVFEEWGLMPKGTFAEDAAGAKKKGKRVASASSSNSSRGKKGNDNTGSASLIEAVARARDACRFRYLTAAAVCVYGIPVYINGR
ncbi:peptidase family C50-domain-containing protein [Hypoxylon trugodes]|uniref:peptidase family C50-domain-containing protein n=1 Tax=Hypoxylon trugodes TaxID=326681 RepID=UPI002193B57B|nr:peptidase family C50-domain-containing protein [Hypoxylon trugodes]KAI1393525.1 peptidase family C50-domain-containing protein [Hypoxylon trugodes]